MLNIITLLYHSKYSLQIISMRFNYVETNKIATEKFHENSNHVASGTVSSVPGWYSEEIECSQNKCNRPRIILSKCVMTHVQKINVIMKQNDVLALESTYLE